MPTILVIDDDPLIRAAVRACLERAGYGVGEADDGHPGLEAFNSGSYDLVIVDLFMPEVEGLETIRAIRRVDPRIPIIAISGGGAVPHMDFLKAAQSFGASTALLKPFTNDELLRELASLLKPEKRRCSSPAG